jgi:hypothetical protein
MDQATSIYKDTPDTCYSAVLPRLNGSSAADPFATPKEALQQGHYLCADAAPAPGSTAARSFAGGGGTRTGGDRQTGRQTDRQTVTDYNTFYKHVRLYDTYLTGIF